MPIFLSHRTADNDKARQIHDYLSKHGVSCYLDDIDEEASSTNNITSLLVDRIHECTHLMALMTSKTQGSWWVPFEIGVARESGRRISSIKDGYTTLPEFLHEWPVLSSTDDLDLFIEEYKKDNRRFNLREGGRVTASRDGMLRTADDFHNSLKESLGQR